jgi:hypothetical protein
LPRLAWVDSALQIASTNPFLGIFLSMPWDKAPWGSNALKTSQT